MNNITNWFRRMSIRVGQSRFRFLIVVAGGLICAAALAIALTIWWLRSETIREAYVANGNLATVLSEQIANSVQSINLVLTEIQSQLKSRSAQAPNEFDRVLRDEDTFQFLMRRLSLLQQAESIALVDKNGRLVNTTQKWPAPEIDLSDRDHFKHFKNSDDNGIYVSNLLVDRIKGTQIVYFAKRVNAADNTFFGLIVVGVRLTYFQHIYESIASLRDQAFLFLHRNGAVIARYPDPKVRAGETIPFGSPWYQLVLQGGGNFRSPGYFDGEARLVAVRPLRDYPLVVNVSESEAAALTTWRIQAIAIGIGTTIVILCSAFLLRALSKQFHRLAISEATVFDKAHELERANGKVDAALNNMSQGLVMFGSSGRLDICNQRYLEMYSLSPTIVKPGSSLREVVEHRVSTGNFFSGDPDQYMADILDAVGQGRTYSKITNLHDGRIIHIVGAPVAGGGWVATHEDVTEQKRAEERIAYVSHHDELTSLPNRKRFCELLEQELNRVRRRRGQWLAVLFLDIDHLKRVNDTLGEPFGDKLLKGVADRLRVCVRDIDMVARLSGDEFAIIQAPLNRPEDAAALAVRVREAIRKPFDFDGHQVTVDISVGIAIAPTDAAELNELLKAADIALHEAKNTGRGTYCFYEPAMNARMQTRDKLERELQNAFANGQFELFYQPVVSLEDNKICSFEALLRWNHPERGIVSPAEFIPIAEEIGLIVPLGEWVLRTACAEAANWPENIGVAVNVSSIQLTSKNLINAVIGAIASAGLQANRLVLEITESIFLKDTDANLATLKKLHELGVQFSMDDYGTGYSSLGYLLKFPFSKIKIDRSFITGLQDKHESRAVVRAITDLARSLKMGVIAEGVETAEELEQVQTLGCSEMQGYLFSPPRSAAETRRHFSPNPTDAVCAVSKVA